MLYERHPRAYDLQYTAVKRIDPRDVTRTEWAAREPYRLSSNTVSVVEMGCTVPGEGD